MHITNFQVKRNKHTNAVGLYDKSANFNKATNKLTKSEKLMSGIAKWASFYRSRPDVFVEDYLGILLKPFQKVLLFVMIHYNYTLFFASRGLGKTWLVALYCVVRCILYPGTKIIVAAKTRDQAMVLISEKIPELISLSTTGMIEREMDGSIRPSLNTHEPNVKFNNGSWIKIVPSTQTARSRRANILVLDEFRMIDPLIYRNVLRRFLAVSRQPGYLKKSEYKNNKKYMERNQEIFLTSPYYKHNWSYQRYQIFIKAMLEGKGYFVCGLPYQISIREGLTNAEQLIDEMQEDDLDFVGWHMEMDCLFFGESEKAYFKTEEMDTVRKIPLPLYNKKVKGIAAEKKSKNEIRVLSCDIALLGGEKNDASVFTLITGTLNQSKTRYKRQVRNITSCQGVHPETQALMIRRLFDDYDCDYIVLDKSGNGISVYGYLCRKLYDNERKIEYMPFYSMNELDDPALAGYHVEEDYEQKIFTITPSEVFNHDIALDLKDKIANQRIDLLIHKEDARELLLQEKWFNDLPKEEQVDFLMPYMQTNLLQTEMVLLDRVEHPTYVKLKEQPGKRKDRYSSLAYGNYFISLEEKKLVARKRRDINIEDIFHFRKPQLYRAGRGRG